MDRISQTRQDAVAEAYRASGSVREAARAGRCGFDAARRVLRDLGLVPKPGTPEPEGRTTETGDKDGTVRYALRKRIVTEADAIEHAQIDRTVWRVVNIKIVAGEVAMKLRERDERGKVTGETATTEPVWWITLKLERIMPKVERDALDGLIARVNAPRTVRNLRIVAPADPHMMVVDLVDIHFGKLAWAPETGQNYDLKIADQVYRNAVEDLLSRASSFAVDEFLMPLGSDFLHIDNSGGMTTSGTPQDVDGRLAKILEVAEAAVVFAVGAMAERGRVVVRWTPGNHDRTLSLCLARIIKAHFRNDSAVTVDVSPAHRKYHRYYATLIGLAHGDEQKHASLPIIMAQERRDDWAETTCREWHLGHFHRSKRVDFLPLDTHNGVLVRMLRSLSAVDSWHARMGFVGTQRSAEGYLYNRTGYVGHFVADVRPDPIKEAS